LGFLPFLAFLRIGRIAAADARPKCASEFHDYDVGGDDDGMETMTTSMK
jgi:hypothetical protein